MKTDAISYRLLKELPETFFELIGRPPAEARRYRFSALEIKDTAVRLDGFFEPVPKNNKLPVYFVEYQHQKNERVYSNLWLKIGMYLEKKNPSQDWHAVVIYPSRSVEQDNLHPYRGFLKLEQVTIVYLDELPEPPSGSIGMSVLKLLASKPAQALEKAQTLIPQVRVAQIPNENREKLIQLIETIVCYQFPNVDPKEIIKMVTVNYDHEVRAFREIDSQAREDERAQIARRLLAKDFPVAEIAELTGLTLSKIKKLKKLPK